MISRGVPESRSPAVLYYVHDPMCSWCYAFVPVWENVCYALKSTVLIRTVLGGLAPDTEAPMPADIRSRIKNTWKIITNAVPGAEFNHDFWALCTPRRSTYPACRAVISAREQGVDFEPKMIAAIQSAYYREARNPSLPETLIDLAREIGLDTKCFKATLAGEKCENTLQEEIRHTMTLGVRGFPTLMLIKNNVAMHIQHDYNNAEVTCRRITEGLETLEL
jgi:putative protein-disulfide isomerase